MSTDREFLRHRTFFEVAVTISQMATCLRAKHGAVIVNPDHRIVCTGYNGSLPGEPHCLDVGCEIEFVDGSYCRKCGGTKLIDYTQFEPPVTCRYCQGTGKRTRCVRTIHAERNAINQAARYGVAINGCRIYVTGQPCAECAKHLAAAGVSIVVPTQGMLPNVNAWYA